MNLASCIADRLCVLIKKKFKHKYAVIAKIVFFIAVLVYFHWSYLTNILNIHITWLLSKFLMDQKDFFQMPLWYPFVLAVLKILC